MSWRGAMAVGLLAAAVAVPKGAWTMEAADPASDPLYKQGTEALDAKDWDRAIELFRKAAEASPAKADAALYWRAYAQGKRGQHADALRTLRDMQRRFPQSRWKDDAQALEVELRGAGQSPEATDDEEMKLVVLNAMVGTDNEKALPLLEKLLRSSSSERVRERALFVLSQSGSPRARQIVFDAAKGSSHPDLQKKAIQYLGLMGTPEAGKLLMDLFSGSGDPAVRKAVLHAFLVTGEKAAVAGAARAEKDPHVRREAIRILGAMGAEQELLDQYRAQGDNENKEEVLQALAVAGAAERLAEIARTETDPRLRRVAVRNLGIMGADATGAALVAIFKSDKDAEVRSSALEGLFIQGNAKALLALAKAETDPQMKKQIVRKLALTGDDEATEYLLGVLEK